MMTAHGKRYEQDFYAWTQEQATLLKDKRFAELDVENLIEEIETLGRSEKRELRSRIRVLLIHLLKWHYHPQPEKGWHSTIREQQDQVRDLLLDSPSLRPVLLAMWDDLYHRARRRAADDTDLDPDTFPAQCPWSIEEVLEGNHL